ncbi:enhancer of polycomb-like-domain-containing protein [Cantharellus anzutake]|uniref:enhancer of polycomb-like-domain-containing protein n=1 Tax=Cantharellus anzutake TaxID=1750568 RepID=UPI001903696F|nr:enhancer of polycomb-like-domain-containing protein [Cantharellus anzutake]KAF8329698.1 enhancer of polycomb-like-domain-containing protein [Cantharellus anzutake]
MGRLDKVVSSAATGGGLRTRNRVTNKTRLKVIDGDVEDAELVFIEEDSDKNKVLDTAGVEHEDAKEEHLVKVLAAATQRISGRIPKSTEEKPSTAHIPIPDATGVVDNYLEHYPEGVWTDPAAYVKSSDTVEECVDGAILGGSTYDMDERDVEWLQKNNSIALGEGSSSAIPSPTRNVKTRGKDIASDRLSFVITEDEIELVMGLFEKFTDEKCPFLHLDIKGLPPLSEYEPLFATPLSPTLFASFIVPPHARDPSHLIRLARTIYPHYKERKIARQGHKIIPSLNFDESNSEDAYVCFRRRDVKSVRKTRRTDTTPAEKVSRLRQELIKAKDLANLTVSREVKKLELNKDARSVLEARIRFIELKRKHPQFSLSTDDQLLVDPERVLAKRPKMTLEQNAVSLKIPRRSKDPTDLNSPYPALEEQVHPHERAELFAKEIERQCEMRKNSGWEDYLDLPTSLPISDHFFHALSLAVSPSKSSVEHTGRSPFSIRIRTGRGGRSFIDRRPFHGRRRGDPRNTPPPVPQLFSSTLSSEGGLWSHSPKELTVHIKSDEGDEGSHDEPKDEYVRKINEQWRFDDDAVVMEEEQRVLIDDFDARYIPSRLSLFGESELIGLSVDESHIRNAELYANAKQESGQRALMAARHQYIAMKEMTIKERMRQQLTTAGGNMALLLVNPPTPDQNAQMQNAALAMQASGQLPMNTSALAAVTQQLQQSGTIPVYNGQMPQSAAHLKKMAQMPMLAPQQRAGFNISQTSQMAVNGNLPQIQQQQIQQPHPQLLQQPSPTTPASSQPQTQSSAGPAPPQPTPSYNPSPHLSPTSMRPPTPSVSPTDPNPGLTQNSPTRPPSQITQQSPMVVPQITGMPFHSALPFNYTPGPKPSQILAGQQQLPQHYSREQLAHQIAQQHQHAAMKNGINTVNGGHPYLNGTSQQHVQQMPNGVPRNGMMMMPPPQAYHGLHMANNAANGAPPVMNMSATNMPLKSARQWPRHSGGQADINSNAPNGNPTGSPVMQHHVNSPNLGGQGSPVRMNGVLPGGRNSPMNPHPSLQQLPQHQPSPLMDVHHGAPQIPYRATASPRSASSVADIAMLQQHRQSQSPHLAMPSPAHQHQMLGNGAG